MTKFFKKGLNVPWGTVYNYSDMDNICNFWNVWSDFMKKRLAIILAFVVFVTSWVCMGTSGQESEVSNGFSVEFNGESVGCTSLIINDMHYVPFRAVFEKMGAYVFYRSSDRQILALSRDGDMIYHIIGQNTMIVNGEQKVFDNPTLLENDGTYMPVDMLSAALNPDSVFYDGERINIQKYLFNNNYHKIIKEVLDHCKSDSFNPENFLRYIDYHIKNPNLDMQEVFFKVNIGVDYPFYQNMKTIEDPYDLYVLVNKYNKLPAGYEQYNLVNMERKHTVADGKQYLLAGVAYEKYVQMYDAAKNEGLSLRVISAYRTENYQAGLYNNKVRSTGKVNADNYSARPGHSEHQTGLAVDINTTSGSFEYTKEFKWLQQHAHEYGFIMRYPKGKEWITGYSYEPWHYRYIGVDAATVVHNEGITYEEYYAKYVANQFK